MVLLTVVLLCLVFTIHKCCSVSLESQNFAEIRSSHNFIDKTLLLREFFSINDKSLVIAAPRGFGKSLNLDMMRTFFTIDMNKTHVETLFMDTDISKDENFMKNELGNHAVLYCSFKLDEKVVDYKSMTRAFRSILYRTFALYPYLSKSRKLSRYDKKGLTWYTGVMKHMKSKPHKIVVGLHFLSRLLKKHHEKDVILMIDDYDSFILESVFTKQLDYKLMMGFHNAILSAVLHKNDHINKTILVGNTCTCIKSLVQLQNVQCVGFLKNKQFAPYFGITEKEVNLLMDKEEFADVRERKEEIRKWYNGYVSSDLKTHVYNTRSTLSFLNSGILKSYWTETRGMNILKYLLIEPVVQDLLNDSAQYKPLSIQFDDKGQPGHIKGLKSFTKYELWNEAYADVFIHLLMEKGYFTFAKECVGDMNKKNITIKIPNEEVRMVFEKINKSFLGDPENLLDRLKAAIHEISVTEKVDIDNLLSKIG